MHRDFHFLFFNPFTFHLITTLSLFLISLFHYFPLPQSRYSIFSLRSSSLLLSFEDDVIQLVKSSKDQGAARLALTSNEYGLSLDQVSTCNTNRFLNFLSFLPSFLPSYPVFVSFFPVFLLSFFLFFLLPFLPSFLPSFTPRLCFFLSCFLAFLLSFFLFFSPSFFPSFLFSFLLSFLSSLFYLSSFFLPSFLPFFLFSLSSFLPSSPAPLFLPFLALLPPFNLPYFPPSLPSFFSWLPSLLLFFLYWLLSFHFLHLSIPSFLCFLLTLSILFELFPFVRLKQFLHSDSGVWLLWRKRNFRMSKQN